jgi:hypothetical protein
MKPKKTTQRTNLQYAMQAINNQYGQTPVPINKSSANPTLPGKRPSFAQAMETTNQQFHDTLSHLATHDPRNLPGNPKNTAPR